MSSLTHRMDNRSKEIFSENIKDFTGREQDWIRIYAADLCSRGESVEICNYGVDNTGGLIAGNLCNNNADNLIIINGKTYKVDIKTIPEWSTTFTFKAEMDQYVFKGHVRTRSWTPEACALIKQHRNSLFKKKNIG